MNTPRPFGGRHPLYPVHAAFVLESAIHTLAFDQQDGLFHSAEFGQAGVHEFHAPPALFRVPGVHAHEFGRKQGCLFASGAGANFNERILGVARILDDQQLPSPPFEFRPAALKFLEFLPG